MESEKLWIEGKISSRENAIIQVGLLNNITQKQLDDYINSIEIDSQNNQIVCNNPNVFESP